VNAVLLVGSSKINQPRAARLLHHVRLRLFARAVEEFKVQCSRSNELHVEP
jgi:hypothetical protein